jgi:DNA polymerase V
VTAFTQRAAEKLRKEQSVAGQVAVFVHTSPFRKEVKQYSRSIAVPLRKPIADTAALVQAAVLGMHAIYKPGFNLSKAGVHLLDLQDGSIEQRELELDGGLKDLSELMRSLDSLNRRYGRGTVAMASTGVKGGKRDWVMRQERKTPDYTTSWSGMPMTII